MALDQIIIISQAQEVSQPDGSLTLSFINPAQIFAEVKPVSGSERYSAGQVRAPAMYRFKFRYRAVSESDVITWAGETFNIRYIGTAGSRDVYMFVDAEKDVAE
jgi:SPP1 family predicted phage head-tail adaptor